MEILLKSSRPSSYVLIVVLLALLLVFDHVVGEEAKNERWYKTQFSKGSENLPMPPILFYSVYMGEELKYGHLPLTIGTMKYNPMITYVIIQVVSNEYAGFVGEDKASKLASELEVPNLQVKIIKLSELTARVKEKLNLDVPFDMDWYYKLCDYKPTLAYLFPEFLEREKGLPAYKYWGYGDLDVIWGNVSRFSHWFQSDPMMPFVVSGWMGTTGAAAWYINEEWTHKLFMEDPVYVPTLADKVYRNLDEGGTQCNEPIDNGIHSISRIQKNHIAKIGGKFNRGRDPMDEKFIDQGTAITKAQPVSWVKGSLKMIHPAPHWPAGRELMFFHHPLLNFDVPEHMQLPLAKDMLEYGFRLPNLEPLMTRFACEQTNPAHDWMEAMHRYQPYRKDCFGKWAHAVGEAERGMDGRRRRRSMRAEGDLDIDTREGAEGFEVAVGVGVGGMLLDAAASRSEWVYNAAGSVLWGAYDLISPAGVAPIKN